MLSWYVNQNRYYKNTEVLLEHHHYRGSSQVLNPLCSVLSCPPPPQHSTVLHLRLVQQHRDWRAAPPALLPAAQHQPQRDGARGAGGATLQDGPTPPAGPRGGHRRVLPGLLPQLAGVPHHEWWWWCCRWYRLGPGETRQPGLSEDPRRSHWLQFLGIRSAGF